MGLADGLQAWTRFASTCPDADVTAYQAYFYLTKECPVLMKV
jgi:hypothetical protein